MTEYEETETTPEEEFGQELGELISEAGEGFFERAKVRTFKEAMVLTRDEGLVIRLKSGERFALTIQQMS